MVFASVECRDETSVSLLERASLAFFPEALTVGTRVCVLETQAYGVVETWRVRFGDQHISYVVRLSTGFVIQVLHPSLKAVSDLEYLAAAAEPTTP